ncbi:MAG TPA: phosphotransferase [Candidatus Polarisedimenticolia bacterium]|nr:phosphotransferase [Candidatus Polarisedimenticolia bacterium]
MATSPDQVSVLIDPPVLAFLERTLGSPARLIEIAGDASTRRFYRATAGKVAAVLVVHPEPLAPDAPLFSNHRILESIGAPVPGILASDPAHGLVLMEDLGDVTLQKHLSNAGPGRRKGEASRLYRQACDLIILLQRKGAAALRPRDFAATCALDRERFLFELNHFHRHFILGQKKMSPGPADEAMLRAFYADLAGECDRLPRVYCHRDFQSRNLMVLRGRVGLIDFQDARMGPYTYDAASLLRDSSLDLDPGMVEEMLDHLGRALEAPPEELRRDFDLMALQRNIKDLGTFGYMATVRGRPDYLAYVPRTLRYIRSTLLRSRVCHAVFPAMERYILS